MSRILKPSQTSYEDMEIGVYPEAGKAEGEDGQEEEYGGHQKRYTLISEEKRHVLEHARSQAKDSMAEILSDAYSQRDKIINTATAEADRICKQARVDGYEAGQQKALADITSRLTQITGAVTQIRDRLDQENATIRDQIIELSLSATEKILKKRIEEDHIQMVQLVEAAVMTQKDKSRIDVHIAAKAADLADALETDLEPLREKYNTVIKVRKEDRPIDYVRIETDEGIMDASVFSQLEQLREQLKRLEQQG